MYLQMGLPHHFFTLFSITIRDILSAKRLVLFSCRTFEEELPPMPAHGFLVTILGHLCYLKITVKQTPVQMPPRWQNFVGGIVFSIVSLLYHHAEEQ